MPTAILRPSQPLHRPRFYSAGGFTLKQRGRSRGFTLAELLVTVGVLVLLVLLFTQLLNSAATITTLGNKQMGADSQARQLLDRMAVDFAQMVKRSDVDFFGKGTVAPNSVGGTMPGNDQIAFYSAVPGYYPSTGAQSPVSLVAYRVNSASGTTAFNKLERLGKGLVWNGVSATDTPVVFMPLTIGPSTAVPLGTWPAATSTSATDTAYELIGPQVFRFEYCYLAADGTLSITPPNITARAAIIVDIAVIDPQSKVLLLDTPPPPQIAQVASQLIEWGDTACAGCPTQTQWQTTPGLLRAQWEKKLNAITTLPRPAISGIRIYERYFYLSP